MALIFQAPVAPAGLGTTGVAARARLPGLHRAGPSTPHDERTYVFTIGSMLTRKTEGVKSLRETTAAS